MSLNELRVQRVMMSFFLSLHYLLGEVSGFEVLRKMIPGNDQIIDTARSMMMSKVKSLWEAFGRVMRSKYDKGPEILYVICPSLLDWINEFKAEMDQTEYDPICLVNAEEYYNSIFSHEEDDFKMGVEDAIKAMDDKVIIFRQVKKNK